jgi:transitional endoplasmic reticulum ATPase
MVEIPPPDENDRKKIFAIHLRNKPLAEGIRIDDLASKTDGYSGADIAGACHKAAMTALRRVVQAEGAEKRGKTVALQITMADLIGSLEAVS